MSAVDTRIRALALCAVFTALLCVLAPVAVPIGPVPITLATFFVLLAADLLGWKCATFAIAAYMLLGFAGLPVFSNFQSGAAPLMGPTGGYLIGYIPMGIVAGLIGEAANQRSGVASHVLRIGGMVLATAVLYLLGTVWFCFLTGSAVPHAMAVCVLPFLPGDALKIAAAAAVGEVVRRRLQLAGLL